MSEVKSIPYSEGELVQIFIDDVKVTGIVQYFTPYDFSLEINEPYENISSGLHIPGFARNLCDFSGSYGIIRVKDVLLNIYRIAKYTEENFKILRELYTEVYSEINRINKGIDIREEYRQEKRLLRQELKLGFFSNQEYQGILRASRNKYSQKLLSIDNMNDDFFNACYPWIIPCSVRKKLIEAIVGRDE